jgi:hypothetical protein
MLLLLGLHLLDQLRVLLLEVLALLGLLLLVVLLRVV